MPYHRAGDVDRRQPRVPARRTGSGGSRDDRTGSRPPLDVPGTSEDLGTAPGPHIPQPVFGATDRVRGLVVGLILTLVAAATRLWNLSHPTDQGTPVFDEKHYVPQGWQVLTGGNWIEDNPAYGLVVHPPVSKWFLALGEWMFGYGPVGWRIMPAIAGSRSW